MVSNIFYFQPYLGKWSNLTHIFQMGWNHQLDEFMEVGKKRPTWISIPQMATDDMTIASELVVNHSDIRWNNTNRCFFLFAGQQVRGNGDGYWSYFPFTFCCTWKMSEFAPGCKRKWCAKVKYPSRFPRFLLNMFTSHSTQTIIYGELQIDMIWFHIFYTRIIGYVYTSRQTRDICYPTKKL